MPPLPRSETSSRRRKQRQLDREADHKQHAEPKCGQADPADGENLRRAIDEAARSQSGENAEAPTDDDGDDHAAEDQQHRIQQLAGKQTPHRNMELHRSSEISLNRLSQPFDILDGKRLIQAVARFDLSPLCCGRERPRQVNDRITRGQPDGQEHDDGNREEDEDKIASPLDDIRAQSILLPRQPTCKTAQTRKIAGGRDTR